MRLPWGRPPWGWLRTTRWRGCGQGCTRAGPREARIHITLFRWSPFGRWPVLSGPATIGHAATLMYALVNAVGLHIHWGSYEEANSFDHELMALAEEIDAPFWKGAGIAYRGCLFLLTGNPSAAVDAITSGITAWRSTGATHGMYLAFLARAYARSDQFDNAWRCIHEAMTAAETTKERWGEAEVHRTAGEIKLMSPQPDADKSGTIFRACARSGAPAAGKVLGGARGDEHGAALARSGQAR